MKIGRAIREYSQIRIDDDFHRRFVIVNQPLEAFRNQLVEFDTLGNERLEIDFSGIIRRTANSLLFV